MTAPFVGRARELRCLRRSLNDGRNAVIVGVFGSGRTRLVRELARQLPEKRFLFCEPAEPRRVVRAALGNAPTVLVVDDMIRVTTVRLHFFRELLRSHRCQVIVIAERSMPPDDLARLRAVLNAARLLRLGPLGPGTTERYFSIAAAKYRLDWNPHEIRGTAHSTHGHPLTMRRTLEVAAAAKGAAPVVEQSGHTDRPHEKRQRHGDGVRR
jgi:hypothetical protein